MPDASVTVKVPVIGVPEHQFTVIVQLAPGASVPHLSAAVKPRVVFTDLMDVLVLSGLVTFTVPGVQLNITSKLVESETRLPLPLTAVDLLVVPVNAKVTDPFRSPPSIGWNVTVAEQLSPAASVAGQLCVTGKSARVDVTDETVNGAEPILLSIVLSVGLAVPTNSVGNVKLTGVTAETATCLASGSATTACGRLKLPTPVPSVPSTIWSS